MHHVEKPKLEHQRITIGHLLLEAGMIVFSILLALSLESWREMRKHDTIAREALVKIKVELARNVAEINRILPIQKASIEELAKLRDIVKTRKKNNIQMKTGLQAPVLSRAAWDSAMATQALAYMDFDTVLALSEIYNSHKWLERLEDQLVRVLVDPSSHADSAVPRLIDSLKNTLGAYVNLEEEIVQLSQSQRFLDKVKK